jgi:hypothetical protein
VPDEITADFSSKIIVFGGKTPLPLTQITRDGQGTFEEKFLGIKKSY